MFKIILKHFSQICQYINIFISTLFIIWYFHIFIFVYFHSSPWQWLHQNAAWRILVRIVCTWSITSILVSAISKRLTGMLRRVVLSPPSAMELAAPVQLSSAVYRNGHDPAAAVEQPTGGCSPYIGMSTGVPVLPEPLSGHHLRTCIAAKQTCQQGHQNPMHAWRSPTRALTNKSLSLPAERLARSLVR